MVFTSLSQQEDLHWNLPSRLRGLHKPPQPPSSFYIHILPTHLPEVLHIHHPSNPNIQVLHLHRSTTYFILCTSSISTRHSYLSLQFYARILHGNLGPTPLEQTPCFIYLLFSSNSLVYDPIISPWCTVVISGVPHYYECINVGRVKTPRQGITSRPWAHHQRLHQDPFARPVISHSVISRSLLRLY